MPNLQSDAQPPHPGRTIEAWTPAAVKKGIAGMQSQSRSLEERPRSKGTCWILGPQGKARQGSGGPDCSMQGAKPGNKSTSVTALWKSEESIIEATLFPQRNLNSVSYMLGTVLSIFPLSPQNNLGGTGMFPFCIREVEAQKDSLSVKGELVVLRSGTLARLGDLISSHPG